MNRVVDIAMTVAAAISMLSSPLAAFAEEGSSWRTLDTELDSRVGQLASAPKGGMVIVWHKGQIIYEHAFGEWSAADSKKPYPLFSVSKSFAAAAAMALTEDAAAQFNLDDSISDHLPELSDNAVARQVTVRSLLSMTSGLPAAFPRNSCVGNRTMRLEGCAAALVRTALKAEPPGTIFEYSGGSWTVLGAVLVAAYNRAYRTELDFVDVMNRLLFDPCGWPSAVYPASIDAPFDNIWVGGGLASDAQTAAALAELLRTGRCTKGRGTVRLLSPTALAAMQSDAIGSAAVHGSIYAFAPEKSERGYGLGMFLSQHRGAVSPGLRVGPGMGGTHIFFNPERGYSGVLLLNDGRGGFERGDVILDAIIPLIEARLR